MAFVKIRVTINHIAVVANIFEHFHLKFPKQMGERRELSHG